MRGTVSGGENQKKKVVTNVPSKSLLGVRGKKGRVSFKKKRSAPITGSILVRIIIILLPNSGEDLKKKTSSSQTGYVFVQNIGILPPNLGEDQKKKKKKERFSPQIGTDFGRNFGFIDCI